MPIQTGLNPIIYAAASVKRTALGYYYHSQWQATQSYECQYKSWDGIGLPVKEMEAVTATPVVAFR